MPCAEGAGPPLRDSPNRPATDRDATGDGVTPKITTIWLARRGRALRSTGNLANPGRGLDGHSELHVSPAPAAGAPFSHDRSIVDQVARSRCTWACLDPGHSG